MVSTRRGVKKEAPAPPKDPEVDMEMEPAAPAPKQPNEPKIYKVGNKLITESCNFL